MVQKPKRIIGLDIGTKYNGVAIIDAVTGALLHSETCTTTKLIENIEKLDPANIVGVGIEKFVLYPWAAKDQSWSSFGNIETIGKVKYILDKSGIPYLEIKAVESKRMFGIARLKDMGYSITKDPGEHRRDALSVALYVKAKLTRKKKTK